MTTRQRYAGILALVFLGACTVPPVQLPNPTRHPLPAPSPIDAVLTLKLTSALADPYPVTSGPAESYGRYAVADQFRALLAPQVTRLSSPSSPRRATLSVHLAELNTRYHRLGGRLPSPPFLGRPYAAHRRVGVRQATVSPAGADAWDADIPAEIRKGVSLVVELGLSGDGIEPLQTTLTIERDTVVDRREFDPNHAYLYTDLLVQTLRAAVSEITLWVHRHLRPRQALELPSLERAPARQRNRIYVSAPIAPFCLAGRGHLRRRRRQPLRYRSGYGMAFPPRWSATGIQKPKGSCAAGGEAAGPLALTHASMVRGAASSVYMRLPCPADKQLLQAVVDN